MDLPPTPARMYGLDLDAKALEECQDHVSKAALVRGDALDLPFPDQAFDVIYSHYLLLWVRDPLRALGEMKRVTRRQGYVLALAEPDYSSRIDAPLEVAPLGRWQTEAVRRQGANPGFGVRLAETFFQAGIQIVETGTIQGPQSPPTAAERELEWAVIESDLAGLASKRDIQEMKALDSNAWARGTRVLHVPTFFACGRV